MNLTEHRLYRRFFPSFLRYLASFLSLFPRFHTCFQKTFAYLFFSHKSTTLLYYYKFLFDVVFAAIFPSECRNPVTILRVLFIATCAAHIMAACKLLMCLRHLTRLNIIRKNDIRTRCTAHQ